MLNVQLAYLCVTHNYIYFTFTHKCNNVRIRNKKRTLQSNIKGVLFMQNVALTLAATPANDLQPVLFSDFVAFIDRSEATTKTYIKNLKQFAAWLNYMHITRPQRADILAYRDYLASEHEAITLDAGSEAGYILRKDKSGNTYTVKCKPNTIKQYLQSVSQFFKWTASNGYYPNIAENVHAPKIKQGVHKKEALTAADVAKIENSISLCADKKIKNAAANKKDTKGRIDRATEQGKRLFAMYLLAVNCGLRTIEIHRANICDLETKDGVTYLNIHGKGHTEADTKKTLAPAVKEAVFDYLDSRTDAKTGASPLFVSTGNRSKGKRIATTTISTMLKKAMQEAGYNSEKLTAHSLRHTTGVNVQKITGHNLYLTQQYMRHENPQTTEIYLNYEVQEEETDIAKRLYNHYHGLNSTQEEISKLENIIGSLNNEQLQTLTSIAAAMAK